MLCASCIPTSPFPTPRSCCPQVAPLHQRSFTASTLPSAPVLCGSFDRQYHPPRTRSAGADRAALPVAFDTWSAAADHRDNQRGPNQNPLDFALGGADFSSRYAGTFELPLLYPSPPPPTPELVLSGTEAVMHAVCCPLRELDNNWLTCRFCGYLDMALSLPKYVHTYRPKEPRILASKMALDRGAHSRT